MKPVAEKYTHYSLLLMRDDCRPRSLHVRCGLLRFWMMFLLILFLAGIGGIGGSVYLWLEQQALRQQYDEQGREMADMRLQLERLTNLDSLLRAANGSVPSAKNEEIGIPALRGTNGNGNGNSNGNAPRTPESNGQTTEQPKTAVAEIIAELSASTSSSSPEAATAPEESHADGVPTDLPKSTRLLTAVSSPLRIQDFTSTFPSNSQVRVRYTLFVPESAPEKRTYVGAVSYRMKLQSGLVQELTPLKASSTRFSLANRKQMDSSLRLPPRVKQGDIAAIEALVELEQNGGLYYESFAIQ